jgi:hypothetical protein
MRFWDSAGGSCARIKNAPKKQDRIGLDVANQEDEGVVKSDLNVGSDKSVPLHRYSCGRRRLPAAAAPAAQPLSLQARKEQCEEQFLPVI